MSKNCCNTKTNDGMERINADEASIEELELNGYGDFQLPTTCTVWQDQATVVVGNALAVSAVTGFYYFNLVFQNPPGQNDSFSHELFIQPGLYTMSAMGQKSAGCGIITWYVDGVEQGTQDWYAAADTNAILTMAVFIPNTGTRHTLRGIVATKNASATNYAHSLVKIWLK